MTAKGRGLDIGTMNLVAAKSAAKDKVETSRVRDAFLSLEAGAKRRLRLSGVNFIDRGEDGIIVVGDAALEMANVFGLDVRRPLQGGLISAGEMDALEILGAMIQNLLGKPTVKDEVCYFSIPASPVDVDRDTVYHKGVFERIISECGFRPIAANEAMAIIFSETAKEMFSGLAFSFGSGMCNVALSVNAVKGLTFSVARGGDWIDQGAARAVGSTSSRMCVLKEAGIDLLNPQGREQEALVLYYKSLIEYALDETAREFQKIKDRFALPRPIPLIVSGGTSKAGNFLEFFTRTFDSRRRRFPITISEVRQASEPLNAVARGLLIQALQEYED